MPGPGRPRLSPRERSIVLLVAAVQFVNILDFVIVMPMGPDFAKGLGFADSQAGLLAAAYTGAAAAAGIGGSFFLDRYDRKPALLLALSGLVASTALAALAWDLPSLMAARVLAGLFGGPATSVALSIVADVVASERRGTAMGIVMGAFGAASVLGLPLGLELAHLISWRAPFLFVAVVGLATVVWAAGKLPSLRGHLTSGPEPVWQAFGQLVENRLVLWSFAMTATVMFAGFIVIPVISPYIQHNLHYPRERVGLLYLVGGAVSFVIVPMVGRLVDRLGSLRVVAIGTTGLIGISYLVFYREPVGWPVMPFFVGFMGFMGFRNVAYNTLTTKVPPAALRARFMSLQSTVQHGASSAAGIASGAMLSEVDQKLVGMPKLALVNMVLSAAIPIMVGVVEYGVRARDRDAGLPAARAPVEPLP